QTDRHNYSHLTILVSVPYVPLYHIHTHTQTHTHTHTRTHTAQHRHRHTHRRTHTHRRMFVLPAMSQATWKLEIASVLNLHPGDINGVYSSDNQIGAYLFVPCKTCRRN